MLAELFVLPSYSLTQVSVDVGLRGFLKDYRWPVVFSRGTLLLELNEQLPHHLILGR
jgi:hypothetical protein